MSAHAAQATAPNDPGPPGADTHGSRQVLHYIIGVGADFVRLLHEQAIAQAAQQATVFAQQAAASTQHAVAPAPQATNTPHAARRGRPARASPAARASPGPRCPDPHRRQLRPDRPGRPPLHHARAAPRRPQAAARP
ncbi:MAG: hypothetical protein ACRYGM_20520, partial [Janthinobacterium lividum]